MKVMSSISEKIDFLSNLVEPVKLKLLTLLPLKEAIRTSMLSTKWRQTWFGIPSLIVHEDELGFQSLNGLVILVHYLLFCHRDSITKFEFVVCNRFQLFVIKEDLDIWIHTLLEKNVKELVLNLSYASIEIPSCLFPLPDLEDEVLHLRGCKVNVPENYDGFKLLHTVKLELESLVSNCPLLTHLMLRNEYQEFNDLIIRSPNLLELQIYVKFEELHLETPKLVTPIDSLKVFSQDAVQRKYKNNTNRFLCCLPGRLESKILISAGISFGTLQLE